MKHLRLLPLLLLLIVHQALWAGPRNYRQAQAIAEKLAAQLGVSITPEAKARSFSGVSSSASSEGGSSSTDTAAAYYVFPYGEDRGYAIVSGDDQMPEIVAYSASGTFDEANMSDGCRAFLSAYKQLAESVSKEDASALKAIAEKRALMATSNYQQPTVSPLLGDIQWDQDAPYNKMCPVNKTSQRICYTGCVATAMAQVMRYWKYPESLLADIPAYTSYDADISSERYEMPQIDKGVKYDWNNMLPTYDSETDSYTQEQADAVATLMLHCGEASNMAYSTIGSSTIIDPQIFVKYWGYDPDMLCTVYRNAFRLKEWCKLIDNELAAKRPVLYAGYSSDAGHQFVCDGSDGKGFYHINWGWGGISDGYFDITILSPFGRGIGSGSGSNGYNSYPEMIIGLQPDNGKKDEPLVTLGDLSANQEHRALLITNADRSSAAGDFGLDYSTGYVNEKSEAFDGLVNVGIKDAQGQFLPIAKSQKISIPGVNGDKLYSIDLDYNISYAFPVGTTELYDIYSIDGGTSWHQCYPKGTADYLEVVATDSHLSKVDEAANLQATIQANGELKHQEYGYFTYTVTNANPHDYKGVISIYISQKNELPKKPDFQDYVDIAAGGSTTHDFRVVLEKEGDLYVWIYDVKHGKMLVNAQKFTVKRNEIFKFKLMSKSINVKEGEYEREFAFIDGKQMVLPVIDGDEAVIKYEIKNYGSTFTDDLPLSVLSYSPDGDEEINFIYKTCTLEGDGGITPLEYRFKPSDIGGYSSFYCILMIDDYGDVDYSDIEIFHIKDVTGSITTSVTDNNFVGYFRDASTAIVAAPTVNGGTWVTTGKGFVSITANKAQTVNIYNLAGQKVRSLSLPAGVTTTIHLPSGIYVIDNKKVMVPSE